MYVKYFIVNVIKRLKPFLSRKNINIVNKVTLQSFRFIFTKTSLNWSFLHYHVTFGRLSGRGSEITVLR